MWVYTFISFNQQSVSERSSPVDSRRKPTQVSAWLTRGVIDVDLDRAPHQSRVELLAFPPDEGSAVPGAEYRGGALDRLEEIPFIKKPRDGRPSAFDDCYYPGLALDCALSITTRGGRFGITYRRPRLQAHGPVQLSVADALQTFRRLQRF